MSLLSNRSLQLHIGAMSVRGTLRAKRSAQAVLARSHHAYQADTATVPASGSPGAPSAAIGKPCLAAIEAVLSELASAATRQKPGLRVALGDAACHLDVVHGNYRGSSVRQLQAIAQACVAEVLGAAVAGQWVRWQLQPDQRHLLIASVDQRDVAAVTQAAARHGLPLQSLQPDFCWRWNQYASALPASDCVFASLHEDYATVAYAQRGAIAALSGGHCGSAGKALKPGAPAAHPVDARTDRLLASQGLDRKAVAHFIWVTTAADSPVTPAGAARWATIHTPEGRS